MDLLIELIVWIFRSLFGDPEAPADMKGKQQPGGPPRSRSKRGPYNYGDNQQRPKTLEEILEEVRREAARKKEGLAPPPAEIPQPRPQRVDERVLRPALESHPAPQPRVAPKIERRAPRPEPQPLPPPPELSPPLLPEREFNPAPLSHVQIESPPETQPLEPIDAAVAAAELAAPSPRSRRSGKAASAAASVSGEFGIVRAIRQAAPQEKREAARQAIVLNEVFGAPRARRPYAPGRRAF